MLMQTYVSDAENIYSIISYQDSNDIGEIETNSDNSEFIKSILESSRKYKDKQIDDIEKIRSDWVNVNILRIMESCEHQWVANSRTHKLFTWH